MVFEALDGIKLVILMAAGLLFAVAGLYLLMRPKPEGSAARIELFGLKFESSSAGLLVFLIGAAFMASPMFVKERSGTEEESPEAPGQVEPAPKKPGHVILPDTPGAQESEPNDIVQDANELRIGATVAASVRKGQQDWYVIPTADHIGQRLIVTLRAVSGPQVGGEVFDTDEQRSDQIGWVKTGARLGQWDIDGPKAYVLVFGDFIHAGTSKYELVTRVEEP
ncbi:MAG: hypothetical protein ABJI96_15130 [Paracoccaceae bacterium]